MKRLIGLGAPEVSLLQFCRMEIIRCGLDNDSVIENIGICQVVAACDEFDCSLIFGVDPNIN